VEHHGKSMSGLGIFADKGKKKASLHLVVLFSVSLAFTRLQIGLD
jgi:hypothetical protein